MEVLEKRAESKPFFLSHISLPRQQSQIVKVILGKPVISYNPENHSEKIWGFGKVYSIEVNDLPRDINAHPDDFEYIRAIFIKLSIPRERAKELETWAESEQFDISLDYTGRPYKPFSGR